MARTASAQLSISVTAPLSTYPVTVNSSPSDIMNAFIDSGYFALLNPSQQSQAQANPSAWLSGHPYLYDSYPSYFTRV